MFCGKGIRWYMGSSGDIYRCLRFQRGRSLLKADEIPLLLSLKVNDAAPFLLPLVEPSELLLLVQSFCTGLVLLHGLLGFRGCFQ